MDSPGGDQRYQCEEAAQQSHGKVGFVAVYRKADGRRETGWDDEGQRRLGTRRKQGNCAKHHSAENES